MGSGKLGTTLKGIGPAYSSKVSRTGGDVNFMSIIDFLIISECPAPTIIGLRAGDLKEMDYFATRLEGTVFFFSPDVTVISCMVGLVRQLRAQYPELDINIENELQYYESIKQEISPLIVDTISFVHDSIKNKKTILVEGANAAMLDIDFGT